MGADHLTAFLDNHVEVQFTLLCHPGADASNWRGEQAIRPTVVQRKVWGGNRTEAGDKAQSIIMSVMRTCLQRLADTLELFGRHTKPRILPMRFAMRQTSTLKNGS